MDAVLRAIATPGRRKILALVRDAEMPAGDIARAFEVSRPAVSQNLRILSEAGLLAVRREGTRRLYRARPEAVAEVKAFIDSYWRDGLDRLKQAAEAEHRSASDDGKG